MATRRMASDRARRAQEPARSAPSKSRKRRDKPPANSDPGAFLAERVDREDEAIVPRFRTGRYSQKKATSPQ